MHYRFDDLNALANYLESRAHVLRGIDDGSLKKQASAMFKLEASVWEAAANIVRKTKLGEK